MNFKQLEYFIAAAETLNITKTAQSMFISQQSVSEQIKKLEDEVGKPLFARYPHMQLTDEGRCFLGKARELLDMKNLMLSELSDMAGQVSGHLRIGIGRTLGLKVLPALLPDFYRLYPNIRIRVNSVSFSKMCRELENGTVDLVIAPEPVITVPAKSAVLFEEAFGVVVPRSVMERLFPDDTAQRIRDYSREVDIDAFSGAPFLTYGEAHHVYGKYLSNHGIEKQVILHVDDTETLLRLAEKGMGCCLCSLKGRTFSENTYCFPISRSEMSEKIVVAQLADSYTTNAMRAFIDYAQQACAEKIGR